MLLHRMRPFLVVHRESDGNLQLNNTTRDKTLNKTSNTSAFKYTPLPFDANGFLFLLHVRTRGRAAILLVVCSGNRTFTKQHLRFVK